MVQQSHSGIAIGDKRRAIYLAQIRSVIDIVASVAGTKLPICASRHAIPTDRMKVDLPAMLGPASQCEIFGISEVVKSRLVTNVYSY